jgi:MFS superfamily sulfate permease-like transporter
MDRPSTGVSIAGLLLPEAVAYSGLANLPPQAGVIALFAGLVCYGLIGRSPYAIVSATSSSAAVLAAATLTLAGDDPVRRVVLASMLVVGAGIAFLLAGGLKLGAMSNLIARPVLRGYTFGLAIVIAVKQWPYLVGLHVPAGSFAQVLAQTVQGVGDWQPASVGCGLAALIALFLFERARGIPGALIVIVASIVASSWLAANGVALTGPIHLALVVPQFQWPARGDWLPLSEFSLALMFILYAESYGSIRTLALRHDGSVQPNRDLVALGVANLLSGLLQGTPVGAGYSATEANEAAGAQSRLAGVYAAGVVLLLVLLFLGWIERIPQPVLAAIVIHAVSHSLRIDIFRTYFRWRRDRLVAVTAVIAVIAFGVLDGLLARSLSVWRCSLRLAGTPASGRARSRG